MTLSDSQSLSENELFDLFNLILDDLELMKYRICALREQKLGLSRNQNEVNQIKDVKNFGINDTKII